MKDEQISERPRLILDSVDTYEASTIARLEWKLKNFFGSMEGLSVVHVKENLKELNMYSNFDHLLHIEEEHTIILDEDKIEVSEAEQVVLNGEFFWEHAAAGEATRLGMGTKYCINLSEISIEDIIKMRREEIEKDYGGDPWTALMLVEQLTADKLRMEIGCLPEQTLPLNIGTRHMLQMAFEMRQLARKHNKDPDDVLKKQKMLIILNELTDRKIVNEIIDYRFFGFDRRNVFFMVQKSFSGIELKAGSAFYDGSHDKHKRLHNHGQLFMQKVHEGEIFFINDAEDPVLIKRADFERMLESMKDMVSYNIEDVGYLTNAIDWPSLALSLDLGRQGYAMTMEIVAQNPLKPQKGGSCFWDDKAQRMVMVESNQLKNMCVSQISYLNKNFNHYPNPIIAYRAVSEGGMSLHIDVKSSVDKEGNLKDYLYFCTPQGDVNFLVKTAYIIRKNFKCIENWKSPATTPNAIKACHAQDNQPGFREFAAKTLRRDKDA